MDQQAEKKHKTEEVIGLGRRTREEIVKWNQMSTLRFQAGGDIRHPWSSFRDLNSIILSVHHMLWLEQAKTTVCNEELLRVNTAESLSVVVFSLF